MIDMDEVKEEAIDKAENTGIIFIDEIDKIASGGSGSGKALMYLEMVYNEICYRS